MPRSRPTIAQLKARIGSLEKEVVELRGEIVKMHTASGELAEQCKHETKRGDDWRIAAQDMDKKNEKLNTQLRAVLTTIKLLATHN